MYTYPKNTSLPEPKTKTFPIIIPHIIYINIQLDKLQKIIIFKYTKYISETRNEMWNSCAC